MSSTETPMDEIRRLARERRHPLDPRQLDGRPLAPAQQEAILRKLRSCPVIGGEASRPAPARGPAAAERPARPRGYRPGPRITEAGMYFNGDRAILVYRSQYNNHSLRAKVLDPVAVNPRTGRRGVWSQLPAALGFLRAEDRMTAEDSVRFERLYDVAICIDCGLPLETDESRARRKGPVCANK
jgi:hypothetical protein